MATVGELYGPAMTVTTQREAEETFARLVQDAMSVGRTQKEAESIVRSNLGYYAGYYDNETRERVERLYGCVHPIFGSVLR